jgi:hypothetical protein
LKFVPALPHRVQLVDAGDDFRQAASFEQRTPFLRFEKIYPAHHPPDEG